MEKRKADDNEDHSAPLQQQLAKRAKDDSGNGLAVARTSAASAGAVMKTVQRTSQLLAPIMLLTGYLRC